MTRPTTTGKAQDLITFTRSTTGTALAKISYGEELVTNGTFDDGSTGWNVSQVGTFQVVSGRAKITSSSGNQRIYQEITGLSVDKAYTLSLELEGAYAVYVSTSSTSGGSIANIPYAGSTAPLVSKQLTFTATSSTLNLVVYVIGTNNNVFIDNISVKEVFYDQPDGTLQLFNHPINKPRIEYDSEGNCLGLLVEEARTNVVPYSDLSAHWNWVNTTDIGGAATAPDGTQTATLMRENTAGTAHIAFAAIVSSSTSTTASIFAKAGGRRYLQLSASTNQNSWAMFDLEQGVVTEQKASGITATIEPYGNGWYRCKAALTLSASGSTTNFVWGSSILATTNGIRNVYQGDGTSGIYLWGAQVETGSFPTSYIPTSGSAVTRAADVASLAVSEFGYNQDQGTVVVEQSFFADSDTRPLVYIGESNANRILLYRGNGAIKLQVKSGNNTEVQQSIYDDIKKAAFRYKKDDMVLAANGLTTSTDTSASLLAVEGLNIYIGRYNSGPPFLNGHIKSVQYYPLGLSNAQLQALTV